MVEPSLVNKKGVSKLHVARTASLPEKGLLSVRVLNLASEPETIYKNTKEGRFEPFENTETVPVIESINSKLNNTESSLNQPEVKASTTNNIESTTTVPIDLSSAKLALEQKHELQKLINEFGDIFTVDKTDFGFTDLFQHRIDVGDHSPIKSKPYRVPFSQRPFTEEQIKTMLEKNIIRPSMSILSSNVVLVAKKDGFRRFCIDFRKLNKITKKETYPLPRIDETLDALEKAQYFFYFRLGCRLLANWDGARRH